MIALGCDHGGYNLICAIKKYLDEKGLEYKEYGTFSEESVDYPVYAYKVATAITSGECSTGILCCGTGIGISIAANKVKGIRAAVVSNEFCAEMTRRHNNANILCMAELRAKKMLLNLPTSSLTHLMKAADTKTVCQ